MAVILTLRNTDKAGRQTVYVQYTVRGKQKRFPTDVKVLAADFDAETGNIAKGGTADVKGDFQKISQVKAKVISIVARFRALYNDDAPIDYVEREYVKEAEERSSDVPFLSYLAEFIELKRVTNSPKTVNGFKDLHRMLSDFQRKEGVLYFDSIHSLCIDRFMGFLLKQGLSNSTVNRRRVELKQVLNYYVAAGKNSNLAFRAHKPAKLTLVPKNKQIIALDEKEFEALYTAELPDSLAYMRDVFMLCASTGLRFSDARRLGPEHIVGGNIRIMAQKTKKYTNVPLNEYSKSILERYNYQMRYVSHAWAHEALKRIGSMVEALNKRQVAVTRISGAKETTKHVPIGQAMTPHCGRKTFITRCLVKGVIESKVRLWTGHENLSDFLRYVDASQGERQAMELF